MFVPELRHHAPDILFERDETREDTGNVVAVSQLVELPAILVSHCHVCVE